MASPAGVSTGRGAPGGWSCRAWQVIAFRVPGTPARTWRGVYTRPLCFGAAGSAVGSSPGQKPVSRA